MHTVRDKQLALLLELAAYVRFVAGDEATGEEHSRFLNEISQLSDGLRQHAGHTKKESF